MSFEAQRLKVLLAGVCGLTLMLGIARFAYTPMLPLMLGQTGLGESEGAWLASVNYLGYLSGALIAAMIVDIRVKDRLYRLGMVLAIITTLAMAVTENVYIWGASRYVAGLSSAAGLMLGSGLVLNWLMRHRFHSELGVHFAGIGAGILLSALIVELSMPLLDWHQQWSLLTLVGVLLAIPAWRWLPRPGNAGLTVTGEKLEDDPPSPVFLKIFMAVYFCSGIGYVVSATFIVDIINGMPGLQGQGVRVFMLIGLAAMPACILWDRVARKRGNLTAITYASILQILGICLPLLFGGLAAALISAILFGATFVGIVSLVLTMAGRYYPSRPAKMMSKMTFSYGIAQILAPALVALVADKNGGYEQGLYLATAAMIVATLLLLILKQVEKRDTANQPNENGV